MPSTLSLEEKNGTQQLANKTPENIFLPHFPLLKKERKTVNLLEKPQPNLLLGTYQHCKTN